MKSPVLFGFYFCISFVLLFSWMSLGKGEISPSFIQIDETNREPQYAPMVIRTPNTSQRPKSRVPQEEVVSESPVVEPIPEKIVEVIESSDIFPSAPEKTVVKILTATPPAKVLMANYQALLKSPKFESKVTPLTLELVDDRTEPRGKMTTEMVSLVVPLATPSESFKVFAHELGHVVDIQYLKSTTLTSDASEKYYDISWIDTVTKKPKMSLNDFVSGYAMTNKYEDFAEGFTYYLFHNKDFAKRAQSSTVLQKKYNFFKKYIFVKQEFQSTSFELDPIPGYNWDTTKIPIALNKYLFYIK